MRKVHYYEVPPEILRFVKTCKPGQFNYCKEWGADVWPNGTAFYVEMKNIDQDWVEIIEKIHLWRGDIPRQVLGVDDEDFEGEVSWEV